MRKSAEKQAFSARLKTAIEQSDLNGSSRIVLGRAFGVSGPNVTGWMTGKKMPSISQGVIVAKRLNVSFEWLYTERGTMRLKEGLSREASALLMAFNSIPQEGRAEVLAYTAYIMDRLRDKPAATELRDLAEKLKPGVNP